MKKIFALIAAMAMLASCDLLNRLDKEETDPNFTAIQGVWYGVSGTATDSKGNVTDLVFRDQMEFKSDGTVIMTSGSGAEMTVSYSIKDNKLTLGEGEITIVYTIITLNGKELVMSTVDKESSDYIVLTLSRTKRAESVE